MTSPVATSVTVSPTAIPTLVDAVNAAADPFGRVVSVIGTPSQTYVTVAAPGALVGSADAPPAAIRASVTHTAAAAASRASLILPTYRTQHLYPDAPAQNATTRLVEPKTGGFAGERRLTPAWARGSPACCARGDARDHPPQGRQRSLRHGQPRRLRFYAAGFCAGSNSSGCALTAGWSAGTRCPCVEGLVPRDDRHPDRRVFDDMTSDRLRTAITRACTAAGAPTFSPHDLRHRPSASSEAKPLRLGQGASGFAKRLLLRLLRLHLPATSEATAAPDPNKRRHASPDGRATADHQRCCDLRRPGSVLEVQERPLDLADPVRRAVLDVRHVDRGPRQLAEENLGGVLARRAAEAAGHHPEGDRAAAGGR